MQFGMNQEQKQNSENQVQAHEAHQREESVACRDARREAFGGSHDAVRGRLFLWRSPL